MIDIIMGYDCNVQCDYCTITTEMRGKALTTAQIAQALANGASHGIREASFGGGEPTIRKDLPKLVAHARRLGYTDIKIASNGLMYAYDDFVGRLIEAGTNRFHVSLMGWNETMYAAIMGRPDFFRLARTGIANLVARNALVVADVIMKNDTWRHLERTVAFWAELGIEQFVLWLVSLTDRNAANRESLVPVSTMFPEMARAFEIGRSRNLQVWSRHVPLCMLPGYHDHVWNVRAERILVVTPESTFWLSESRITANTFHPRCDACSAKASCSGIRQDYLANVGDHEVNPRP